MKPICKHYECGYCALSYNEEYDLIDECNGDAEGDQMVWVNCAKYEPEEDNGTEIN